MVSPRTSSDIEKSPTIGARISFLAFVGLLDSAYLLYHHITVNSGFQTEPSICNLGGSFNCDAVARSQYSDLFGIPIASYGLVYYVFLLLFALLFRPSPANKHQSRSGYGDALLVLALLSLPMTVTMASISFFKLHVVCLFCGLQYLLNLLLWFLALSNPERSPGLFASLASGLCALPSYLCGFSVGSVVLWLLTVLTAVAAYFAPPLILKYVVEPHYSDAAIEGLYDVWKKSPSVEIPIDTSSGLLERDFTLGPDTAEVTIVEFSDFECPFCRRAAGYLRKIVSHYRGRVRLVYKNYPLDVSCNTLLQGAPHQFACQAALLARCAGMQGAEYFWRMHDALYELEPQEWGFERLFRLPDQLGLNNKEENRCLQEEATMRRIKEDIGLGNKLSILGTPTIYLNGRMTRASFDQLDKLVGRVLKDSAQ